LNPLHRPRPSLNPSSSELPERPQREANLLLNPPYARARLSQWLNIEPGGDLAMSTPTEAIRMQSMASDSDYQRLADRHAHYAALLDQLSSKRHLTEQEQLEETRLKKMKLRLKDEMANLSHKKGTS
jgi:uncharacterized protein YdcH (DUF465 family)